LLLLLRHGHVKLGDCALLYGFLLSGDPGAGKTIMAGCDCLKLNEMISRERRITVAEQGV